MFVVGAGSVRSTLAFDAAIRAVNSEVNAVVVGRPVILAGDDVAVSNLTRAPRVALIVEAKKDLSSHKSPLSSLQFAGDLLIAA